MPNENDANASEGAEASADDAELERLQAELAASIRRRLLFWAIRWTLGFAAIAAAVQWRPGLSWLWWVGAIVAFISLLTLLSLHVLSRRRLELARRRLAQSRDAESSDSGELPP